MIEELYEKCTEAFDDCVIEAFIDEKLSKELSDQIGKEMATPDMRPMPFDVTLNAWLHRIGCWGKLTFTYTDPTRTFRKKTKINQKEFLQVLTDDRLQNLFGIWSFDYPKVNKLHMLRDVVKANGKPATQKLTIDIKLKPELRV